VDLAQTVIIDGRLIGYRHGGIATYARQLAIHCPGVDSSLSIRLGTRRDPGSLADRSIRLMTPPHHRLERISLGLEIRRHNPDLLHSTDYVQPILRGIRSIVTIHDLAFLNDPELVTQDSFAYYSQITRTVPETDRVIAVSEWTKQQLLSFVPIPEEQVSVIPNGHEPAIFNPESDHDLQRLATLHPDLGSVITSERPIVLIVGTIEPRKRHDIILNGFENHFENMRRLSGTEPLLIIAGQPGWLAEDVVQRIRRMQRRQRVIWLRDVSDHELASLYRQATLLVMPSVDEGFGLPVLESMACGTPALVANTGALPELVGDAGFIDESADAAQWSDKIGRILSDHETRDRRSKRSIERAEPMTWRETAHRTVSLYREVLND
jgi:glycosyltransferase involved in cell wall biosynthesis